MNQIEQLTQQMETIDETINKMRDYKIVVDALLLQKKVIEDKFNEINTHLRNEYNIKSFAKKIIEKKNEVQEDFIKFLKSKAINGLIWGPTQLGKTKAMKDVMDICLENHIPVIISCDNKTDQLEQFMSRIRDEFEEDESILIVKANDSKIGKILTNGFKNNKKIIIFCLDNAAQIRKINDQLAVLIGMENIKIPTICILHDEADVITKDEDIINIEDEQSESHKEWLRMTQFLLRKTNLKRIFVSATPENIVYKYPIEYVSQSSTQYETQLPCPPGKRKNISNQCIDIKEKWLYPHIESILAIMEPEEKISNNIFDLIINKLEKHFSIDLTPIKDVVNKVTEDILYNTTSEDINVENSISTILQDNIPTSPQFKLSTID